MPHISRITHSLLTFLALLAACSALSASAQTTQSQYPFLEKTSGTTQASADSETAQSSASAGAAVNSGGAQGVAANTTRTSGSNEFHTQTLNPTGQQNSTLNLNRAGSGGLAPVFY